LAKGIAQASELVQKFNQLAHVVIPGVVKWRYTFENDWSGDPAIFFWVIVTDEASAPRNLRQVKAAFISTALADDLLEQARHLVKREPKRPNQASLRRAVSTAYYALFHLLVSSAILQWKSVHQRAQMARGFDHGTMKDASKKTVNRQFDPGDAAIAGQLKAVAQAFIDLQQNRHAADYSYLKKWSRTEAQSHVDTAAAAFGSWKLSSMRSLQRTT
ncbi:MAG: hypothetical protein ABSF54_03410, partial [Bryobacteraceae bacterium]